MWIFTGSNSVNTTVKDITTATENKPVPLDCPASDGDYTWEYVPSNPSLSKDLFSATNTYLANVTSSSATGYYRCLLDGSPMHRFHAVSKFMYTIHEFILYVIFFLAPLMFCMRDILQIAKKQIVLIL